MRKQARVSCLFAAVNARVGGKLTFHFGKFNKWRAAEDACHFGAVHLRARLVAAKGQS